MCISLVMPLEQILNHKISTRKIKKSSKVNPNKEKNNKVEEEQQSQKKRLSPDPIIYDPNKNQKKDIQTAIDINDDNSSKQDQEQQIVRNAKEIANYSLDLHKDMINTYNSVYSQLLQDISNYSYNDITILKRFMDYPFDNKNMYTISISNGDKSLKLLDNIMTKNMDTFIKSIELTQRFYKDIVQSYLNCIKKSKIN
jgi:hypothetical protein